MEEKVKSNMDSAGMVCPVCGKQFYDVRSFAQHMMEHSDQEQKRKEEEERNNREIQRKHDMETLERLYVEKASAEKKYENARKEYAEKYGGLIFPATYNNSITDLFDKLFF